MAFWCQAVMFGASNQVGLRPMPPTVARTCVASIWARVARTSAVSLAPDDLRALRDAVRSRPDIWVFLGLLISEDGTLCRGAAAAADAAPEPAERALRTVLAPLRLEPARIETTRWSRGGRSGARVGALAD